LCECPKIPSNQDHVPEDPVLKSHVSVNKLLFHTY
jgi:hypothetical protein